MSTPPDQDDTETRLAPLMEGFARHARAEAGEDNRAYHLALAHKLKDESERRGYRAIRDPLESTYRWDGIDGPLRPVPPSVQQRADQASRESRVLGEHAIAHMRMARSLAPPSDPGAPRQR